MARLARLLAVAGLILASSAWSVSRPSPAVAGGACERFVAPDGRDSAAGTEAAPWATLGKAVSAVPDRGCTVWFSSGVYRGNNDIGRDFDRWTTFRSIEPYGAVFEGGGYVLDVSGRNMMFRGFEFRHSGPGSQGIVVYVGGSETERIAFRDDIFHDSYDNDLLKILDGARSVSVRGSLFYNQGPSEQHIDVNSVTNVLIEGNVFFNDFEGSGRSASDQKHFIVIKDSNENDDRVIGASNIAVRRNVFLSFEGGLETFVQVGNDGKPYYEAFDVAIENNLMLGDSSDEVYAAFGVSGARDVTFANNTVVGDLPSSSFAMHVDVKDANPDNRDIAFWNNVWSDPSGTMGDFSGGDPSHTSSLTLEGNLYWNGGRRIPPGELLNPSRDDRNGVIRNPRLEADQDSIVLPRWDGSSFPGGGRSIRAEFVRLVGSYAAIPMRSAAVGRADPAHAPAVDILGHRRDPEPDLGAFEALRGESTPTAELLLEDSSLRRIIATLVGRWSAWGPLLRSVA